MPNIKQEPETYDPPEIEEPEEKRRRVSVPEPPPVEKPKRLGFGGSLACPRGEGEPMYPEPLWVHKVGRQNACLY